MDHSNSRDRIIHAANEVFLSEGTLPISLSKVAELADVSRSLIYTHFPGQRDLMKAVIADHTERFEAELKADWSLPFVDAAHGVASSYFDYLLNNGPALAFAPRDSFLGGDLPAIYRSLACRVTLNLARIAAHTFRFSPRNAIASVIVLRAFPEETALLAWRGKVDSSTARQTLANGISDAIGALTYYETIYPTHLGLTN